MLQRRLRQLFSVYLHVAMDVSCMFCTHRVHSLLPPVAARLPACALLQVLLSDQSGFLPSVYRAQGNELVSLTPWQVGGTAAGMQRSSVQA